MMESMPERGRDSKNDIEVPPVGPGSAPDRPEGSTLALFGARADSSVPLRSFNRSRT